MSLPAQLPNGLYRLLLQASWARGKDLAQGAGEGWLRMPTPSSPWNAEVFWRRLQALPTRPSWPYQDDIHRPIYDPLDAPQVVVPGLGERYRQTWLGAEAGVRALWPSEEVLSPGHSYLLQFSDWVTTVQRSCKNRLDTLPSVMPTHTQRTNLKMLADLPLNSWLSEPFSETCGALRRAVVCGLLWPGQIHRARAATFQDSPGYTGAAQAAQAWLAVGAALMITDSAPNIAHVLKVGLRRLAPHSQIRAIGEWTYAEFATGTYWLDWKEALSRRCHYYPADHVVPNCAWVISAFLWGGSEWKHVLALASQPGFDPVTRSLIAGALLGLAGSEVPNLPEALIGSLVHHADHTLACARLHTVIR